MKLSLYFQQNNIMIGINNNGYFCFSINDLNIQIDLYYYRIDNNFMRGDESVVKGLLNFKELILYWKKRISEKESDNTFYIPLEFYDEYISLVKCQIIKKDLILIFGETNDIQGYDISPSLPILENTEFIFTPEHELNPIKKSINAFILDLNKIITQIDLFLPKIKEGE